MLVNAVKQYHYEYHYSYASNSICGAKGLDLNRTLTTIKPGWTGCPEQPVTFHVKEGGVQGSRSGKSERCGDHTL